MTSMFYIGVLLICFVSDRYNTPEEYEINASRSRELLKRKFRFNQQFVPINGEAVDIWIKRIASVVVNLESYSTEKHVFGKRGAWASHYLFSSCFMCDQATACRFYMLLTEGLCDLVDLGKFVWKLDPKSGVFSVVKPPKART